MSDPQPTSEPLPDRPEPADEGRLVLTAALRIEGAQPPDHPSAIDPDALRLMVREMLEDELRGAFGAQVTRGVRRLVRAEVAALLAARDLQGGGK